MSVGVFSLVYGYRRHRRIRAPGVLLAGLALLWAGLLFSPWHHGSVALHAAVMTLGGTLIGVAHLLNLRHVHDASCAHLWHGINASHCFNPKIRFAYFGPRFDTPPPAPSGPPLPPFHPLQPF